MYVHLETSLTHAQYLLRCTINNSVIYMDFNVDSFTCSLIYLMGIMHLYMNTYTFILSIGFYEVHVLVSIDDVCVCLKSNV